MKLVGNPVIVEEYILVGTKLTGVTILIERKKGTLAIRECERDVVQMVKDLTQHRIKKGHDFTNNRIGQTRLPVKKQIDYYFSYYLITPGHEKGPERLVRGKQGEIYYTPNHYGRFVELTRGYNTFPNTKRKYYEYLKLVSGRVFT